MENAEFLEHLFCSSLAPRGQSTSWRTPCAMDVSVFLQKKTPAQLAKTTYTLPRQGTTKGVSGTELFGEEWAHQLVSQCVLPSDVSLALEAPLRQPLSASIGRRTTVIPGVTFWSFNPPIRHNNCNAKSCRCAVSDCQSTYRQNFVIRGLFECFGNVNVALVWITQVTRLPCPPQQHADFFGRSVSGEPDVRIRENYDIELKIFAQETIKEWECRA